MQIRVLSIQSRYSNQQHISKKLRGLYHDGKISCTLSYHKPRHRFGNHVWNLIRVLPSWFVRNEFCYQYSNIRYNNIRESYMYLLYLSKMNPCSHHLYYCLSLCKGLINQVPLCQKYEQIHVCNRVPLLMNLTPSIFIFCKILYFIAKITWHLLYCLYFHVT